MPPNAKWNNLNEMAFAKDGVLENNDFLKAFGLTVKERVVAKGVQIQTPSIEYAGGFMVADILRKTDWSTPKIVNQKGGFVVPGKAREIVVLFNSSAEPASNQDRGAGRARKYMERLQESCRDYGMHVFNWAIEDLASTYPGLPATVAIEKKMCALKGASLRPFVIYIDDRANKTHDVLKLMERFCEIPTQHVCFDVALRKGEKSEQSNCPQYVTMKLNLKGNGLNSRVKYADGAISPICVNVILNEDVFHSNLQLVQFVGAMCCAGQTSNKIMSLPAPLKIADAYANRGSRLFVAYKKYLAVRNQDLPRTDRRRPDARALTDTLCYDTSSLRSRRLV